MSKPLHTTARHNEEFVNAYRTRAKVLIISHLYPYEALGLPWGNLGTFVRDLVLALRSRCDVRLLIPCDCVPRRGHYPSMLRRWWAHLYMLPKTFSDEGVNLDVVRFVAPPPRSSVLFGYGASAFLPILWRARAIHKKFPFDIIHAHTAIPDGIVAIWLGAIFRVPTVITSQQGDVELVPANPWNRATLRYTLGHAGRVIAVSKSLKKTISCLGVGDGQIKVIPNGFDPAKFSARDNENSRIRRTQSEKVILFLGQLVERKDPLIVLRSLARLRQCLPHVRLIMVGDGVLRRQVEEEICRLGLTGCVDLIGEVPHFKVPDYIRAADLMCLPSHAEGWPTVIFEALSQGVPVIGSRVGGIPEAIASEEIGLLVEPGDVGGLTEALRRGLTMSWNHSKIREYATEFTWQKIAEQTHREYQALMARNNRTATEQRYRNRATTRGPLL